MQQKILILAANPKGTTPLRLDEEVREIDAGLQRARHRERFILEQRWAVRSRDIRRAMLDFNPQIVHFSGHGTGDEGLVFEDETGLPKLVDGLALAELFSLFADVECIVLNGCYSEIQAEAISQHINYVIGMSRDIGDSAAIEFAVGFYDALGSGQSVEFAYKFGCAATRLTGIPEQLTPILKKKPKSPKDIQNDKDDFQKIIDLIKKQENKEIDVITISANNYDRFLSVDEIRPDHESVILKEFSCAGGSGANTVCGLSMLGKKTSIVGCVKDDDDGLKIKESFSSFSVDNELLIIENDIAFCKQQTGKTWILVEKFSARRLISVIPGINNCLSEILRANNGQKLEKVIEKVKKSKILHLTSFAGKPEMDLQLDILEQIRDEDIVVSFTPGAIYVAEGLNKLSGFLVSTNILFLYTEQLNRLLERSDEIEKFKRELPLKQKVQMFFDWKIRKQMTHPMILIIRDYLQDIPMDVYQNQIYIASHHDQEVNFYSHRSQKTKGKNKTIIPEDTTGSGDALVTGFLYGILEQKDIITCADFGLILCLNVSKKLGARSNLLNDTLLNHILH
ncbi:MAG: PfkB family carbohydrate kinase [Rhizonema sp. PD37]|nr:PfkB family carbohydrate kinase [Rhizonema sp. PD37]